MTETSKLRIIIFSLLLIIGQYSLLIHSTEHPFHLSTSLCITFDVLSQAKDALVKQAFVATFKVTQFVPSNSFFSSLTINPFFLYARGPPYLM